MFEDTEVVRSTFKEGGRVCSDGRCSQGSVVFKAGLAFYVAGSRYVMCSNIRGYLGSDSACA